MSGACRSAARSAVGKSGASIPISTCSIRQRRCGCSYSIGSSMVTMWRASRWLISLTSAASVVVLPDPVGPPTRTRPRGRRVERFDVGRQVQGRKAGHGGRQAPYRRRRSSALVMEVDPEAPDVRRPERAVRDADVAVLLSGVRRQRRRDRVLDLLAAQRRFVERRHDAVHADRRRRAGHEKQIAAGPFDDLHQPPAQASGLQRRPLRRRGSRAPRSSRGAPAFSSLTSASRSSGGVIGVRPARLLVRPIAISIAQRLEPGLAELRVRAAHRLPGSSGWFRNRTSGTICRNTSSSVP